MGGDDNQFFVVVEVSRPGFEIDDVVVGFGGFLVSASYVAVIDTSSHSEVGYGDGEVVEL